MKTTWTRSVQMTLCAAAICAMGAVNAQTPQAPASVATPQSSTQTPAQASPSQARGHEARKGERHHRGHRGERHQAQRGKYANPHQHEAAAVRAEERAGRMQGGEQGMDQYQRNALARCEVFRENEDRQSCANRVRSSDVSGSVRDGGVLREYTEQVPVRN